MRYAQAFLAVAILGCVPLSVKASEVVPDIDTTTLTLDAGFVGRPVTLELFDGAVTLAWDAATLIAPSSLKIQRLTAVTSTQSAATGFGLRLEFLDQAALSKNGQFRLSWRALRPPQPTEKIELNLLMGDTTSSVEQAQFRGEMLSGTLAAGSRLEIWPVFRTGLMREGWASWYRYKRCLCAASPDVPKGTRLLVSRTDDPSRSVVVTVNDWGPNRAIHPERVIDLDKVAFKRLGNPRGGLMRVRVAVLPRDAPRWAEGDELPPPNWIKLLASQNP